MKAIVEKALIEKASRNVKDLSAVAADASFTPWEPEA
jgi:hypothetical protein